MSEFAVPSAPKPKPSPQGPALSYTKPDWSSPAKSKYSVEILKNGTVVQEFEGPAREFITIGRLPLCDLELEHPFNEDGKAFLYDLASGHGTRVNKQPVNKHTYVSLTEGDQIKFGESTRICIFHTDHQDEEEESEEKSTPSVSLVRKRQEPVKANDDEGITWGLPEDAVDEEDEDIDENDPKAIEAAEKRLEERTAEQKARMKRLFGDGDDDSDDDSFYDRTGAVEKNKTRKTNKGTAQKVETYDTLVEKQKMTENRIADIEAQLKRQIEEQEAAKKQISSKGDEEDDLESYMEKIDKTSSQGPSKASLQKDLQSLNKELIRLNKLVKLTKPTQY
ncbi:hypothetical protein Unana1_04364 [Umbelopsis nana]